MVTALGLFREALKEDPLSGRYISRRCWNQHHQEAVADLVHAECDESGCECLCHERVES